MPELLLSQFHFLRPGWLLLLLPFASLSLLQLRRSDLGGQWRPVIADHLLPQMIVPGSQRKLFSPLWVSIVLSPLLVIAVAGPSWQRGDSPFAQDSAALVIAVDLSQSMRERDVQPSRLQRARDKIMQLARRRGDAYTALIAYSGTAHTVLPLSDDSTVLLHYLDALQVGILPRRGKALESVLPLARELLAGQPQGGTLLIVGDGAADTAMQDFDALREDRAVQLLVWGIGKSREELDEDLARGVESGAQPLQEKQLTAIADHAGGHYRRLSTDDGDIDELLRLINRHYQLSEDSARPWIDGGYYLLPPIMILFLLWFRTGWVLRW